MPVDVFFKGATEFVHALDHIVERADKSAAAAMKKAGELIRTEARGRINNKSGKLAKSIVFQGPDRIGFGSYEMKVGATAVYARKHELGKRSPHSGPSFPFFRPGFEAASMAFPQIFSEAWKVA